MKKIVLVSIGVTLASLLIAGCTSPLSTSPQGTAQHDALLEKVISASRQVQEQNYNIKAWEVTWKDSTTAVLEFSEQNKTSGATTAGSEELKAFPSTSDATNYVNSIKAGYTLASTVPEPDQAYARATGHAPSVYKSYEKISGDSLYNMTLSGIFQADNIVITATAKQI
ncbi:MAG: hypothetical protein ACXV3D_05565 [Halobacteriota archaeon]